MPTPAAGLSNARFERVTIRGARFVLKHLHVDDDWIARATGDITCRPLTAWRTGLLDRLPARLDHTIVGCATGSGRHGWGATLLMRDVGPWLVPDDGRPLPLEQHRRFLAHMAELHATFWNWHDEVGLMPLANRLRFLAPATTETEQDVGGNDPTPAGIAPGWQRLREVLPAAAMLLPLLDDPSPLLAHLESPPHTLIHGDWKAGNLGSHADGRTILLDWALPGQGPACADLAWYLAVNCDRLPETKEAAIDAYRAALEATGTPTDGWWDRHLDASLLAALLQLGWSKVGTELGWWIRRLTRFATQLW